MQLPVTALRSLRSKDLITESQTLSAAIQRLLSALTIHLSVSQDALAFQLQTMSTTVQRSIQMVILRSASAFVVPLKSNCLYVSSLHMLLTFRFEMVPVVVGKHTVQSILLRSAKIRTVRSHFTGRSLV